MISKEKNDINFKKFVVGPLCTNCYIISSKKTQKGVLIDPGSYDSSLTSYIKNNHITLQYIINTHGHPDHTQADTAFGLPVLIHELDVPYLKATGVHPVYAERFIKDGDIINFCDFAVEIIHTPGHTPGSVSIRCADLLFSGDTLFYEGVGRTDLPGGSQDALFKSIRERLFVLPDSIIVLPGHGPETTIGHEKEHNPFLV